MRSQDRKKYLVTFYKKFDAENKKLLSLYDDDHVKIKDQNKIEIEKEFNLKEIIDKFETYKKSFKQKCDDFDIIIV